MDTKERNALAQKILNDIIEKAPDATICAMLELFDRLCKIHGGNAETNELHDRAMDAINARWEQLS